MKFLEKKEKKRERPKVGNNNGQLRIAMPPRAAYTKPPGPEFVALFNENMLFSVWFRRVFLCSPNLVWSALSDFDFLLKQKENVKNEVIHYLFLSSKRYLKY